MALVMSTNEIYYDSDQQTSLTSVIEGIKNDVAALGTSGGVMGIYTGDGKAAQTVTLEAAPSLVIVYRDDGVYSGMAKTDAPMMVNGNIALQCTSTGFTISRNAGCGLNSSTHSYVYYAV